MRFWFDADNAPHVLVMRPISEELEKRGHEIVFTARDRGDTCDLLDMYGIPYTKVGGHYRNSATGRVLGTLKRALQLRRAASKWEIDVSFGHGSRALPIASWSLGIPSVTMYDYEWVNPTIFNRFCTRILLPEVIDEKRCREAGIDYSRVRHFPGFKEQLYLADAKADPAIADELGLRQDRRKILLRPPATTAHYHNPEAERIMRRLLEGLLQDERVQLVLIPRGPGDEELVKGNHPAQVIIPRKQYDGPSLILCFDAVIGGGGTMTREAAILGVPAYSFFMGRAGAVDKALGDPGLLVSLHSATSFEELYEAGRHERPHPQRPLPRGEQAAASTIAAELETTEDAALSMSHGS